MQIHASMDIIKKVESAFKSNIVASITLWILYTTLHFQIFFNAQKFQRQISLDFSYASQKLKNISSLNKTNEKRKFLL